MTKRSIIRTKDTPAGDLSKVVFLTPKEVAIVLRMSQRHVYKMLQGGLLPHIRIGLNKTHYRIHVNDLKVLAPGWEMPPAMEMDEVE